MPCANASGASSSPLPRSSSDGCTGARARTPSALTAATSWPSSVFWGSPGPRGAAGCFPRRSPMSSPGGRACSSARWAPKTLNRRILSLSSFYKYLGAAAAELRLPITVPNPAHAQFIARSAHDPVREREALSATRARQLKGLPSGDSALDARERAILRVFLYTGMRIGTACQLRVRDFHDDCSTSSRNGRNNCWFDANNRASFPSIASCDRLASWRFSPLV